MKARPKRLTHKQRRKWHIYLYWLRERMPLSAPVIVRTCLLSDSGDSNRDSARFYIRVGNHLDYRARIETLAHEWAHCRIGWDTVMLDHNAAFWAEFGAVDAAMVTISAEMPEELED